MGWLAPLACAVWSALAVWPSAASAAVVPPEGALVTDGPVRAVAVGRGRVYFGGEFSRLGSFVGSNMRLDWTTGKAKPGAARTNGQVSDIIADGQGGWYLGGGFDWVEGGSRSNLVHVRADGRVHEAFDARVDGFVSALALDGDRLYVAGTLRKVDGRERTGIALVDATTGRLDTEFRYPGTLPVNELAVTSAQSGGATRLYAQGYASFEGPGPVQALDPFSGAVLPGFEFPFEPRKVGALAVRGDTLYVGGGSGHYQGSEFGGAGALVAVDGQTGDHRRSFAPGVDGSVEDIEVDGDRLVIGGRFDRVGSLPTRGVAAVEAESGQPDAGFEAAVGGKVADVALADGLVHAAVGEEIVSLDSSGGRAGSDAPSVDGPVDAVATQSGVLYAGGRFGLAGAARRAGLAAVNQRTGRLIRGFRPSFGPGEHAQLALAHGHLYVGDPRGIRAPIAAVSPASGGRLRGFDPPRTPAVYDFAVGSDRVFGAVGGATKVIAFDANSGRRKHAFRIGTPGYVADLDYARGRVYLGGNWNPRQGARSVIAVSPRSGRLVKRFDPHADGPVQSVAAAGRQLFLAGPFTRVRRAARGGGAAVMLRSGRVSSAFRPSGMPRRGGELAVGGGRVYARDTRRNRLKVFRARDGRRLSRPRWSQITAVAPTGAGAWLGAGIGKGEAATWFLAFARPR